MTTRRALTVLGVIALVVGLAAACSGSGGHSGNTLVVWDQMKGDSQWAKMVKFLDNAFEKKYHIHVEHVSYPFSNYNVKTEAAVAANSGPDVTFQYGEGTLYGATLPLDHFLTPALRKQLTLLPQARSPVDGKIHVIPYGVYPGMWYVNKALLRKAGISTQEPTDFAGLLKDCSSLKAAGIWPIDHPLASPSEPWATVRITAWLGGQLLSLKQLQKWNDLTTPWTDPRVVKAHELFMEMVKHGCFGPKPATQRDATEDRRFRAGKAAMTFLYSTGNVPAYEHAIGSKNLDVWQMPPVPGDLYGGPTIDAGLNNGIAIMRWTSDQKAAWKYVAFYEGSQGQKAQWDYENFIPNSLAVRIQTQDPVFKKMLTLARNPKLHYGTWTAGVGTTGREPDVYNKLAPEWVSGRLSLTSFLNQVQQARMLDRARLEREHPGG